MLHAVRLGLAMSLKLGPMTQATDQILKKPSLKTLRTPMDRALGNMVLQFTLDLYAGCGNSIDSLAFAPDSQGSSQTKPFECQSPEHQFTRQQNGEKHVRFSDQSQTASNEAAMGLAPKFGEEQSPSVQYSSEDGDISDADVTASSPSLGSEDDELLPLPKVDSHRLYLDDQDCIFTGH